MSPPLARAARPPHAPTRPRAPRPRPAVRARARPPPAHRPPTVASTHAAPGHAHPVTSHTLSHMLTLAPAGVRMQALHTLSLLPAHCLTLAITHTCTRPLLVMYPPRSDASHAQACPPESHRGTPYLTPLAPHSSPSPTATLPPGSPGVVITHVHTPNPAHTSSAAPGAPTCALSVPRTFNHRDSPLAHPQLLHPGPQPHWLAHPPTVLACTSFPRA